MPPPRALITGGDNLSPSRWSFDDALARTGLQRPMNGEDQHYERYQYALERKQKELDEQLRSLRHAAEGQLRTRASSSDAAAIKDELLNIIEEGQLVLEKKSAMETMKLQTHVETSVRRMHAELEVGRLEVVRRVENLENKASMDELSRQDNYQELKQKTVEIAKVLHNGLETKCTALGRRIDEVHSELDAQAKRHVSREAAIVEELKLLQSSAAQLSAVEQRVDQQCKANQDVAHGFAQKLLDMERKLSEVERSHNALVTTTDQLNHDFVVLQKRLNDEMSSKHDLLLDCIVQDRSQMDEVSNALSTRIDEATEAIKWEQQQSSAQIAKDAAAAISRVEQMQGDAAAAISRLERASAENADAAAAAISRLERGAAENARISDDFSTELASIASRAADRDSRIDERLTASHQAVDNLVSDVAQLEQVVVDERRERKSIQTGHIELVARIAGVEARIDDMPTPAVIRRYLELSESAEKQMRRFSEALAADDDARRQLSERIGQLDALMGGKLPPANVSSDTKDHRGDGVDGMIGRMEDQRRSLLQQLQMRRAQEDGWRTHQQPTIDLNMPVHGSATRHRASPTPRPTDDVGISPSGLHNGLVSASSGDDGTASSG